ncbi:MAG: hypothetical protein M3P70_16925 [Actinomycetota bacterium]|nr:hypothetical protein [Actinomycetota bacterium]
MGRTLTISDKLYEELELDALRRGISVEQLLERWHRDDDMRRRRDAVDRAEQLQRELSTKYGEMRDSAELVREDRER